MKIDLGTINRYQDLLLKEEVTVQGTISDVIISLISEGLTKGNNLIKFTVTDDQGRCKVTAFPAPSNFQELKNFIITHNPVIELTGTVIEINPKTNEICIIMHTWKAITRN